MTTETLQLHHIANNLPYGLKVTTPAGIRQIHGYCNNKILLRDGECLIKYCKPIMHHISSLTKPVRLKGYDEPVVPMVILYNLSQGIYDGKTNYHHVDVMSTDWICIDKGGSWLYNFRMFKPENDVRLECGYGFEIFVTDLRNDNKKIMPVFNQNLIFTFLDTHHFNYRGIPDNIVEYITYEFNPYV